MWLPLWQRKHKPGQLKSSADYRAGQVGGELGHVGLFAAGEAAAYAASISTNSLRASVGIGSPAARQFSKLNWLHVCCSALPRGRPLADTSWQCRDAGDITAILFL